MTAHRVGIMGGTFDPVHYGHLVVATEVAELLDLETVIFSPAALPWHKTAEHLAPAEDRLAMLVLAMYETPNFVLTDVDLVRGGNTYTIDTLEDLDTQFEITYPDDTVEWFFIAGADALSGLAAWKSPEDLLRRAHFVGVNRPGHEFVLPNVTGIDEVIVVEIEDVDISSSDIRDRVALGQSIEGLVPESVASYISEHGLYRGPSA